MDKDKSKKEKIKINSSAYFTPHSFQTKVKTDFIDGVRVFIKPIAYSKMWHYVDICDEEVSWLGIVENIGCIYIISDVYLVEQNVSSAESSIDEEAFCKLMKQLILEGDEGGKKSNNIRFLGHSHHTMSTNPSHQDDLQMKEYAKNNMDFFVRGIFNKKGRIKFCIFLFKDGEILLELEDVPWSIYPFVDKDLRSSIESEIKEKVKPIARQYEIDNNWPFGSEYYSNYKYRNWGISYRTNRNKFQPNNRKPSLLPRNNTNIKGI